MPISSSGQGFSKNTATKQTHFKYFVGVHLGICQKIFNNWKNNYWLSHTYHYIDLNAGTGTSEEYGDGSPILFLQEAQSKEIKQRSYFVDISEPAIKTLEENVLQITGDSSCNYFCTNNEIALDIISKKLNLLSKKGKKRLYGLLYSDENGTIAPFEKLTDCLKQEHLERIDILIYLSATNVKRCFKSNSDDYKRLTEYICDLPKKHWQIRQPEDKHQWCFLFGTNWSDKKSGKMGYPEVKKLGFYDITSQKGQDILERLAYTNDELRLKQNPILPGLEEYM